MTHSRLNDDNSVLGDDHWIFEQLGSPEKQSGQTTSFHTVGESVDQIRRDFDEKLQIYADNMRKLIITARKEIKDLKSENNTLKQKLHASGLIECPACLFRFKPEQEHHVLPKYIKVYRGKLSLEIDFFSLSDMSEWLTLNKLDKNVDGLPTMMPCEDKKPDLTSTGSILCKVIKEKKEKANKIIISTRPRDNSNRTSGAENTTTPKTNAEVGANSATLLKTHSLERSVNKLLEYKSEDVKELFAPSNSEQSDEKESSMKQCRGRKTEKNELFDNSAVCANKTSTSATGNLSNSISQRMSNNCNCHKVSPYQNCPCDLNRKEAENKISSTKLLHSSREKEYEFHDSFVKCAQKTSRNNDCVISCQRQRCERILGSMELVSDKYPTQAKNEENDTKCESRRRISGKENSANTREKMEKYYCDKLSRSGTSYSFSDIKANNVERKRDKIEAQRNCTQRREASKHSEIHSSESHFEDGHRRSDVYGTRYGATKRSDTRDKIHSKEDVSHRYRPSKETNGTGNRNSLSMLKQKRGFTRDSRNKCSVAPVLSSNRKRTNMCSSSTHRNSDTTSRRHSPRSKRRKHSLSSPIQSDEEIVCETASISSSDLIVVDEEEVEDGEIVE
ncbi:hypothetical protein DICVIV_07555 [Dictyocaulus viviparus]|uniref:Uncharacterized protein n=1 Tax=Dictyocaulus viviparus TaxID=29172 RepID=A0A0D8XRK2_DICVI|nr:hypothetical protein DICVIV_07555 [Dictyocaulus viviparus]